MNLSRRRVLSAFGLSPLLGGCGSSLSGVSKEVTRPLAFGYYGSNLLQLEETRDHVSFHWVMGWGGFPEQVSLLTALSGSGKRIVLGCLDWYKDEAKTIETFQNLSAMGLLQNIWCLYPIDEPDVAGRSEEEVILKNTRLRAACQAFPELRSSKLGVFYGPNRNYPGLSSYDLVGFDHYGVDIFSGDEFTDFRARTGDSQKIWVIPGASDPWRDSGSSFVQASNLYPEIGAIVPFLWLDNADPANGIGLGIRSNGLASTYRALGTKLLASGEPSW